MSTLNSERQTFDPETLSHLHRVFQSCWQEAEAQLSLSSEQQSSLRRTIASRLIRDAARGEVDETVLRRRALLHIIPATAIADNSRRS
jgi:hypothetical protein